MTGSSTTRGSGARHERCLSESQNSDTVDKEVSQVGVGKNLGQELSLDITDTALAADLVGQGVGDGIGDGLGVGSGTVGLRNDKSEDVLNKDILGDDIAVDLHTYLEDRSLCEGCGALDLAVDIQADVGLHGIVERGVGGLGISRSPLGLIPVRVKLAVRSTVMVTFVS
jgi:hypothetical protein